MNQTKSSSWFGELDSEMRMTSPVNQTVERCAQKLGLIILCIKALCFVLSRVDNRLLAGASQCFLDRLLSVLNAAAKLLFGFWRYDHVTQLLPDWLHWLPVSRRVIFKLSLLTCKALHGNAPGYVINFGVRFLPLNMVNINFDHQSKVTCSFPEYILSSVTVPFPLLVYVLGILAIFQSAFLNVNSSIIFFRLIMTVNCSIIFVVLWFLYLCKCPSNVVAL